MVVQDLLEGLGCDFQQGQAGLFVWAKVPAGYKDGYALSDRVLYEAEVFITPGGIFGPGGEKLCPGQSLRHRRENYRKASARKGGGIH